jgi:hypothetical protein
VKLGSTTAGSSSSATSRLLADAAPAACSIHEGEIEVDDNDDDGEMDVKGDNEVDKGSDNDDDGDAEMDVDAVPTKSSHRRKPSRRETAPTTSDEQATIDPAEQATVDPADGMHRQHTPMLTCLRCDILYRLAHQRCLVRTCVD